MKFNINKYTQSLKQDMMGGLLAAIIGLPMGLAFGVQSGLGPQAGIFTAIALAILASLFGGTKTLISDPTGPMTVVAATVVSLGLVQAGSLESAWPLIIGTFILAGIFEIVFGVLNFGKYVKFLPYPVLSGFMAGIGVIIISVQLFPMLGYESPKGFLNIILEVRAPLANINYSALLLGALTIAIVYLLPILTKKIPSILVALVLSTTVAIVFHMDVPVIGAIPKELPPFRFAEIFKLHFSDLKYIITPAIMLGGLGLIDTLLTSVVADNITKTKHNSKWTVIGQGIGNIFAAMFGGIPGAGATMGTVTNIKSGAKTKLSGIMKGVFLLLIILSISDFIQFIPMSVLAGILITIGIGIIDYKGVKLLLKVPRQDTAVWLIVLLVTLFDNLLDAVGVGFVLSAIFFIGKMSKHLNQLLTSSTIEGTVVNEDIPDIIKNKIHVKKLEGPLFFGFADAFRAECQQIDHVLAVILNMKYVPFLDQSGIVTLESVIGEWHDRGIQVYITGGNASVLESLNKVELIPDLISLNNCFDCFEDCLLTIAKKVKNSEGIGQCEEALLDDKVLLTRKRLVLNPN